MTKNALDNPEIESETTISYDPVPRGLAWIVKQSHGEDVFIGGLFSMSFKLEKVLISDTSDNTQKYKIHTFCNYNSYCAIFKHELINIFGNICFGSRGFGEGYIYIG